MQFRQKQFRQKSKTQYSFVKNQSAELVEFRDAEKEKLERIHALAQREKEMRDVQLADQHRRRKEEKCYLA